MSNSIFGVSEQALKLSEDRSIILSGNLVNASTPHYKAKDFNFQEALKSANQHANLDATNGGHLSAVNQVDGAEIKFRQPTQMSLDGNTVDAEIERKNFLTNALHYQVNLTFIQNKTDQLIKAIKGE